MNFISSGKAGNDGFSAYMENTQLESRTYFCMNFTSVITSIILCFFCYDKEIMVLHSLFERNIICLIFERGCLAISYCEWYS